MEQFTNFGWSLDENKLVPVPSTLPAWPDQKSKNISCDCLTGCKRTCSCSKKGIPCYSSCPCQRSERKCGRIKCTVTLDTDSGNWYIWPIPYDGVPTYSAIILIRFTEWCKLSFEFLPKWCFLFREVMSLNFYAILIRTTATDNHYLEM